MQLDLAQHEWLRAPALTRLFTLFRTHGAELRVVGGAVRDALSGVPVQEIDCAVTLPPEQAEALLQQAGLRVERTGFAYGTITAVAGGVGYEITSLRRDVATDGRRAVVTYTTDWREDAARRDFTFNALYADAEGRVTDFFDGIADLKAGRVRFIGNAAQRIAEDYLRILRFFRFHALLGRGACELSAVQACAAAAAHMRQLSVERIWHEIKKLLASANPLPALQVMAEQQILQVVLPEMEPLQRLERLVHAQRLAGDTQLLPRFAALLPPVHDVAKRWKLSGQEAAQLKSLASIPSIEWSEFKQRRNLLFHHGKLAVLGWVLLVGADRQIDCTGWYQEIKRLQLPEFPLHGIDLAGLGLPPGPAMGDMLRTLTDWWLDQTELPDRAACLAEAQRRIQNGY